MSLATFKKKSINRYSSATSISGKPPGGHWLPQGPFGGPNSINSNMLLNSIENDGPVGFSLNGPYRLNNVNRSMKFSKNGTSFKGIYPKGYGGTNGRYPKSEPIMNVTSSKIEINGNSPRYIKPSVLSTYGMLRKKNKWAYNGKYPYYWVQPIYTGPQVESSSQQLYIENKACANDCEYNNDNIDKYKGYYKAYGPTGCKTSMAGYTMNTLLNPYTKELHKTHDASSQIRHIQRKCQDQTPEQKPFPYAVQTGTGIIHEGITVSRIGSACNTSKVVLTPV